MKIILPSIVCLIIISCTTYKWKKKFVDANISKFYEKYSVPPEYNFILTSNQLVDKSFRNLTRKEVKKDVVSIEKIFALIPDSVHTNNVTTDSFYTNRNKISYIKAKGLQTKNIHLFD